MQCIACRDLHHVLNNLKKEAVHGKIDSCVVHEDNLFTVEGMPPSRWKLLDTCVQKVGNMALRDGLWPP
jgi:hypothetical protein